MLDFKALGLPETPTEFALRNAAQSLPIKLKLPYDRLELYILAQPKNGELRIDGRACAVNSDFPRFVVLVHYHDVGNPLLTDDHEYYNYYIFSASEAFIEQMNKTINPDTHVETWVTEEFFINLVSNQFQNVTLLPETKAPFAYDLDIPEEESETSSTTSSDDRRPPVRGVEEDIDSGYAPANVIQENQDLSTFYPGIGYITDNHGFLCTAFVLKDNIIIAPRHAFNNKVLNELRLNLPHNPQEDKEFYFSQIIERGEQMLDNNGFVNHEAIVPDYILLKVLSEQPLPELVLNLDAVVNTQNYYVIGYADTDNGPIIRSLPTNLTSSSVGDALVITYTSNTEPGFSGAVFISQQGQVLGFHCRTSLELLSQDERTALSFRVLLETYPTSVLAHLLAGEAYQPQFFEMSVPLPAVDTVIAGLKEREEAQIRIEALGETPSLGNTHTYRCMLARWLLKSCTDKKIKFKAVDGDDTHIKKFVFNMGTAKETLSRFEITKGALKNFITKDDLEKQAAGIPIIRKNDNARKLLNLFFAPEYWEVKIRKTADGEREWVPLTQRNGHQPAIHMGHKLAAIEYWLMGSKDYQKTCVAKKMLTTKYNHGTLKQKRQTKAQLADDYAARYKKYETPGYLMYGTPINHDFMQDPKNYRFEWGVLNSSEGKKLANRLGKDELGKTGKNQSATFADLCPPGMEFKTNGFVPKK